LARLPLIVVFVPLNLFTNNIFELFAVATQACLVLLALLPFELNLSVLTVTNVMTNVALLSSTILAVKELCAPAAGFLYALVHPAQTWLGIQILCGCVDEAEVLGKWADFVATTAAKTAAQKLSMIADFFQWTLHQLLESTLEAGVSVTPARLLEAKTASFDAPTTRQCLSLLLLISDHPAPSRPFASTSPAACPPTPTSASTSGTRSCAL
jgi:hypothetical protein